MPRRIALFGGSFDPVHIGHLLVARAALEEMKLDRIFFVPAAQSPFKPDRQCAPGNERLRLLRLALAGEVKFEVDDQEVARGGLSYTIDTVGHYRSRFPDAVLFYIIGADHIAQLPKWRSAAELAGAIQFLTVPRPDQSKVPVPAPFQVQYLQGFPIQVSSSQIRDRIAQELPIDRLVPPGVAEAIRNYRLYI